MKTRSARRPRPQSESSAPSVPAALLGGVHSARVDRVIHQPVRLAIVSALAVNDRLTFSELKGLLDASDGNLSVHTRKLEEAGYVLADKAFVGRVPRTAYQLTDAGRAALASYMDHMESLIGAVRAADG